MSLEDWRAILNDFGFPVIACGVLAWFAYKQDKQSRADRMHTHKEHQIERKTWFEGQEKKDEAVARKDESLLRALNNLGDRIRDK